MKVLSLAVAMLAAVSMVVTPVAPSFARDWRRPLHAEGQAQSVTTKASRQKIAAHAARGEAAILSKAQMDRLAKSDPKLHARLMTAYNNGSVPSLTPKEKKMLTAMTQSNLESVQGGRGPDHPGQRRCARRRRWFAVGFLAVVAFLIFLYFVAPSIFRPQPSV